MKSLIALGLLLAGCTTAVAGTLNPLVTPDNAVAYPGFPSAHGCGGDTWNADETAHGFCYRSKSQACSGRGCQPVVNTEYYDVNWNTDGSVLSSALCGTRRHHNPQVDTFTYQAGYSAANCHNPALTASNTTTIDNVNYYDFGASPSGQFELLRGTAGPFIYQF